MKNLNRFQRLLVGILTFIFLFTIILVFFKNPSFVEFKDNLFNVVTSVRYTFFEYPMQKSQDWFENILNLDKITEENRLLKENSNSIIRNQAYIEELEYENQNLIDMLDFKNKNSHLNLKSAVVIFRDFDRWNNIIKVNIGSLDNVKVNDAVLLPEGLIGRVESVEDNSSIIRLLISKEKLSKVAVKILLDNGEHVEAIIDDYNYEKAAFELSLLETSEDIKTSNKIVTSGSGGVIPGGILVGEIVSKELSQNELGYQILVKPAARFESFKNVFVVVGSYDE